MATIFSYLPLSQWEILAPKKGSDTKCMAEQILAWWDPKKVN